MVTATTSATRMTTTTPAAGAAARSSEAGRRVDEATIRAALAQVSDPEIPAVSIVDLGIVERVDIGPDRIDVELLPTFVGCPALEVIRSSVEDRLASFGRPVEVTFGYRVAWTSDRITPEGRAKLRESGFAPPMHLDASTPVGNLVSLADAVPCPYCGSRRTVLENVFGPTQCRSIRYCTNCRQPFEEFKAI
jgi:ring-1,2-phenylacetyl-CoA epoxidase subunit PaaD